MKDKFLAFLLLALSFSAKSQEYDLLAKESFDWGTHEIELKKEERIQMIDFITDESFRELIEYRSDFVEENIDNFHFLDFSGDGRTDIVYYGFAGSESNRTLFFQAEKDKFVIKLDVFGEIIKFQKGLLNGPSNFTILEYACCAEITNHFLNYVPTISSKNGGLNYELASKYAFIEGTKFPEFPAINPVAFKVVNEVYTLRLTPEVNNQNMVAQFPKGATGYSLGDYTDETSRVWWFVIMNNDLEQIESRFESAKNAEDVPPKFIGWMSSRYLEEL